MAGADRRANRVVEAHRLERRALRVSLGFVVAAAFVALVPALDRRWSAIHLFGVGGLLSAIAGTTQMLGATWATAPAPRRRSTALQRWSIGAGAVAITAGMALDLPLLIGAGGVAAATGLVVVMVSLLSIRRTAATDRFDPALDGYLVALCFGVVGVALGVVAATGTRGPGLRAVHVGVNLLGLVGIVIAATLPFFAATQLRTRMSSRATSTRLRALLAWLGLATGLVAWGAHTSVTAWRWGLLAWAVGLCGVVALLPWPGRRQLAFAGPRAAQLAAGLVWWLVALVVLSTVDPFALSGSRWLPVLLVGGYGQILVASVAYLAPVVHGGGHERLSAGFELHGSWVAFGTVNAAAFAAVAGAWALTVVLVVATAVDTAVRSTLVVGRVR